MSNQNFIVLVGAPYVANKQRAYRLIYATKLPSFFNGVSSFLIHQRIVFLASFVLFCLLLRPYCSLVGHISSSQQVSTPEHAFPIMHSFNANLSLLIPPQQQQASPSPHPPQPSPSSPQQVPTSALAVPHPSPFPSLLDPSDPSEDLDSSS